MGACEGKAKLDRFDRRFEVYEAVQFFLSEICSHGSPFSNQIDQFLRDTRKAQFLFGRDVAGFIGSIMERTHALEAVRMKSKATDGGPEAERLADRETEILRWFADRLSSLPAPFDKHLDLTDYYALESPFALAKRAAFGLFSRRG